MPTSSSFASTDLANLKIIPRAAAAATSTSSDSTNFNYSAITATESPAETTSLSGSPPVGPGHLIGIVVGTVFGVAALFSLCCWQWWRIRIRAKAAKESTNNQIALNSRTS